MNLNIPLHSLSPKELEIMQYVHEHSDAIVSMSIQTFAQEINYGPEPDTISYLIKNGAKVAEVQVEMKERVAGTSYLNFARSISYMFRMLMSILFVQNFRKR